MEDKAARILKQYASLKAERGNWESHWDEVAKYIVPRKDNVYGQASPGEKRANRLFDSEAIRANDELASALHGMLTNPSLIWFGLSTGDKSLDRDIEVGKWLHDTTQRIIRALNESNFQTEILETYQDLGSVGTSTIRIEEDEDEVVRFNSAPVYGVVIDEDNKGRIDTVIREFEYNLRQIIMEYGEDALDEDVRRNLSRDPNQKFKIIHVVAKRPISERGMEIGTKGMPFKSVHVMVQDQIILRESGFEEFPYAIPRWSKTNCEMYGRSPGMKALSDVKMINSMKKVSIQSAQLSAAPPLQVPDNGFLTPINLKPFGTTYKRPNMKEKIEPLFTAGDTRLSVEFMDMIVQAVRKAYHLDKLNLVENDRMTATEVNQRRDEQLRLLGPILGRLSRELLKPIIDRVYGIMERKGLFLDPPEALEQASNLSINYVSSIAQAQLSVKADNMARALQSTAMIIEMQPEVMDNVDGDAYLKQNMEIFNVDPIIMRAEKEVEGMRQSRAEAQQKQAENENATAEADVINKIGQVENGQQQQQ